MGFRNLASFNGLMSSAVNRPRHQRGQQRFLLCAEVATEALCRGGATTPLAVKELRCPHVEIPST